MPESLADAFKRWKNRIDKCGSSLKEEAKDWKKFEEAYEGKILDQSKSDFSGQLAQVNLAYVDVRSSIPKLYSQNPYIFIEPTVPEADLNSEILEKIINSKLDEWHIKARVEDLIKGCKLNGRAYLKVSYKFDKDKIGRQFVGDEPNDEIVVNYVAREDLIIPRDASNFSNARWVAHKIKAPIRDIRDKFNLKKDDKPTTHCDVLAQEDERMPEDEKEDFQYGTYYEIEDRENHTLSIIVDGVDRFVVKPYPHPYDFYTMYVALEWNDLPGKCNTMADLHFWMRQLIELCEIKTQQHNHRRKLNSKYKWRGSSPTDDQITDLTTYKDATFVTLKADQDFEPVQHATIGQEVYLSEQSLRQDITVVSGMNEMKQGLPQVQKTAREAMAIVNEAQDVISYRAGKVEDAIAEVIKKCVWLIQNRYDTTRVISLTNMEEAEYLGFKEKLKSSKFEILGDSKRPFVKFVGTDLMGKMRVKVKAGSTLPINEAQRKADITQLIDLMGKSPQMAAAVDTKEMLKEIGKLLHIENKRILLDGKTPEQENSLLKRNIPVLPNMNENHEEHLAAHQLEHNNTPAFIMHVFAHNLMKSFLDKSQFYGQVQAQSNQGLGGLNQNNISGFPQGSSVPPAALPQTPVPNSGPQVATTNQLPV